MKIYQALAASQLIFVGIASAFCPQNFSSRTSVVPMLSTSPARVSPLFPSPLSTTVTTPNRIPNTQLHAYNRESADSNYLLDEFRTADGEIINPYKVLKVGRHADRKEIRQSYRMMSKKYHPDGARFREVLPGNCNDQDDVRDQWERIKLSYEILSDKKLRIKYNRHSALDDPTSAFGRMSMDILGWGMTALAKGVFHVGDLAAKNVKNGTKGGQKKATRAREMNVSSRSHVRPIQYVPESNMAMQNNAVAMMPLASGMSMDFGFSQVEKFFKSEAVGDVKRTTLIAVSWGLLHMAKHMHQFGEIVTNHAATHI